MLIIFVALIAGPLVAGKYLPKSLSIPLELLQPTGLNNNDTFTSVTGSALINVGNGAAATSGGAAASTSTAATTSS